MLKLKKKNQVDWKCMKQSLYSPQEVTLKDAWLQLEAMILRKSHRFKRGTPLYGEDRTPFYCHLKLPLRGWKQFTDEEETIMEHIWFDTYNYFTLGYSDEIIRYEGEGIHIDRLAEQFYLKMQGLLEVVLFNPCIYGPGDPLMFIPEEFAAMFFYDLLRPNPTVLLPDTQAVQLIPEDRWKVEDFFMQIAHEYLQDIVNAFLRDRRYS